MFALCNPKHQGSTPRGTPGIFWPKVTHPCWFERRRHSIANFGRMVTDSVTVTMESLSHFRMVPSLTPYDLPFPPEWEFHIHPRYANGHISATAHSIHLYSAHPAVIFAIAQLSCLIMFNSNCSSLLHHLQDKVVYRKLQQTNWILFKSNSRLQ